MPPVNKKEDEEKEQTPPAPNPDDGKKSNELLEEINKIKENMVTKEEYAKLETEKNKLQDTILEMLKGKKEEPVKSSKEIAEEMRTILSEKGHTSLEYVTKSLQYRQQLLKETDNEVDCFDTQDPKGRNPQMAEAVANALQECVDKAGGSQAMFEAMLKDAMKHYQDPIKKKK